MNDALILGMRPDVFAALLGAFAGALLGILALFIYESLKERKKISNLCSALRAEINFAKQTSTDYLADEVNAPSYRLPVLAYSSTLPTLLETGSLCTCKFKKVLYYYSAVNSFNLILDDIWAIQREITMQNVLGALNITGKLALLKKKAEFLVGDTYEDAMKAMQ
jgi:hypothetical protein